jgi:uncharacterized delta-60 repeat protein
VENLERRTMFGAGDPDATFDGSSATDGINGVSYVIPAADGKVVVVGTASGDGFTLTRANVDGSRDTTFGQQGLVMRHDLPGLSIPFVTETARHLNSGKFALICREGMAGDASIAVFNPDGSLDFVWSADLGLEHIEFQNDGKLVYAGTVRVNDQTRRAVVRRLNADGSPDTTFGASGEVALGKASSVSAMGLRSDGRVYVSLATMVNDADSGDLVAGVRIFRLLKDGALDTSFNSTSFVDTPHAATLLGLGVMPSNALVLLTGDGDGNSTLRRYSVLGWVESEYVGEEVRQAKRMIVDAAGRVLVMHSVIGGGSVETRISRFFDPLGADTGYGVFGTAAVRGDVRDAAIYDGDGLVLVPVENNGSDDIGSLVRLQGGGGIRTTLNSRGTLHIDTNGASAHTSLWIRKSDGRLVVRYGDDDSLDDFAQSFAPSRVKRISLWLGLGSDTLTIGRGVKGVYAFANSGEDTINGGAGDDILSGGDGFDLIHGNDGNDQLSGGIGEDTVFGGAGNDRLFGGDDSDDLHGDAGDDYFEGGWGNDGIDGGAGNDTALHEIEGDDDSFASIESILEEQP